MKSILRTLSVVALGAVMLYGLGVAFAAAPQKADMPCPGCPHASADNAAASPMMKKMTAHLEEMKSAVAALRESEKKLEGTEDPKAFRAAVIGHLKKLDDLQASHVTHMESMMGRMHGGMPGMGGMHHAMCPDCKCKDCRSKDCNCGHVGDCCCGCGKESGHAR